MGFRQLRRLQSTKALEPLIANLWTRASCFAQTQIFHIDHRAMSGRKDFLSQKAPENYVAGLGRGATGFTTRSDLGPKAGPSEEQMKELLAKRAQQLGAAPPTAYGAPEKKEEDDNDDDRFQDPDNETGLFATGTYDRDDDEADRIYQEVDEKMERRRKARRFVAPSPFYPQNLSIFGAYGLSILLFGVQIADHPSIIGKCENNKNEKNTNVKTRRYPTSLQT